MDIKTLRFTYLNYFKNQLDKNEPIDTKVLMGMAQNINSAAEVIKGLKNEGLIEGISIVENDPNHVLMQSNHEVKLTEKGITYLESKDNNTDKAKENLTYEQFMSNEIERINKLSSDNKKSEVQNKILLEYYRINNGLPIYDDNIIIESELKQTIKSIVKQYYPSTPQIVAKQLTKELCTQGYSSYIYSKNEDNKIHIEDLLTTKGKERIDKVYGKSLNKTLGELSIEEFYNLYGKPPILNLANIKISPIFKELNQKINSLYGSNLKKIQQVLNNYPLKDNQQIKELQNYIQHINNAPLAKEYYNIQKQIGDIQQSPELQKNQKSLSELIKEPPSNLYKELTKNSKSHKESESETYTFEGILGQNCGEVVTPTSEDEKRIQEKGFKVENGIKVLRGFANSAILAFASNKDENYQREENIEHLNAIEKFVENMRASAKYLPEVTLIARGYEKLERINLSGTLSKTQKGELDNLEYYKLTVSADKLYRIDGNHRLEALKKDNYYIPFSIIIWEDTDINLDDEAFLFYFLNSKAKKLTTEENIKGLVNAKNWTDNELETANVVLPYIKYFKDKFEEHTLFNREYYRNSHGVENVKTQILNVLELINKETGKDILPFNKKTFGDYIGKLQEILSQRDRFKYLREHFRCFPQFVFYTLYKYDGNIEDSISFINAVNKWAEYYKHDSNSFIQPDKMFNNASRQLDRKINIFVAMPFYDQTKVDQFNKTLESIIEDMKQEDEILKDKLNLYPIMTYKAESTDILANMDKQIGECDIFIADISNHGKSKVNPNVMFELGRVYDKKKFLLIRNKDNKISNSAFDIQHIDYIPIDYGMGFDTSMKENLKPRIMNIIKNIIGFC